MSTGLSCDLYIDGAHIPDGCSSWEYTPWAQARTNLAVGTGGRTSTTTGAIARALTGDVLRITYTTQGNTSWWDALSFMPGVLQGTSGNAVETPCAPGQVVRAAGQWRANRPRPLRWRLTWRDAAHAVIGSAVVVNSTQPANSVDWSDMAPLELTAPAGTVYFRLEANSQQPSGFSPPGFILGDWVEFRHYQISVDQPLGAFFDGDTPDTDTARYAWTGTANQSASVEETRQLVEIPEDPTAPVALSGLNFTWGRATSLDQPEPSSCHFTLSDAPGGPSFTSQLRTGLPVQVLSTGTVYGSPDTSTVTDPGFEAAAPGTLPGNIRPTAGTSATVQPVSGGQALQVLPTDPLRAAELLVAPAVFDDDPAAWDAIPATAPGQSWSVAVDVRLPAGAAATVQPVTIADPSGEQVTAAGPPMAATGTGAWQTLTTPVTPTAAGQWLGVVLRVFPTGSAWYQLPGSWADQAGSWLDHITGWLDNITILGPGESAPRTVLAFDGRITDISASWDAGLDAALVEVTAVDFTSDLGNIKIGDEPFPVEAFGPRFERVVQLAREAAPSLQLETFIDDSVAAIPLAWQDIDAQPVMGLLQDYTASVDGVLWSAVHQTTGPYLRVEDPSARPPAWMLTDDTGSGLVEVVPSATVTGVRVSACDVLRDPVRFVQSVSDVASGVTVTWQETVTDPEGQTSTVEHSVSRIDEDREAVYGQRRVSLSSLLADPDDAEAVALRLLARAGFDGWRAGGVQLSDATLTAPDPEAVQLFLTLLDGTARIGLPVLLDDLPPWAPLGARVTVYLEGATCTYEQGAWDFQLTVSSGHGTGDSVAWAELDPSWAWVDFDPTIQWTDLVGVGPEVAP